jgi:hypothetical protein
MQTRQLRLVLAWAELHQGELLENWQRARAGETPSRHRAAPMIGLTLTSPTGPSCATVFFT